jgi:tetratricopeptide (TPR) repeat protein
VALAVLLQLPEHAAQEQDQIVAAVRRWLQDHPDWLLILDNADDRTLVQDFLPTDLPGRVLLTSRALATGTLAWGMPMARLPLTEGALFLLRRAKRLPLEAPLDAAPAVERAAAETLCQELDGLPLALDQAAAYLEETGTAPAEYLTLYRQEGKTLRAQRGELAGDHPPITITFALAFEKVAAVSLAAAELLRLCAFLHPEGIPEELLTEGAAELGDVLGPAVATPIGLVNTRAAAYRYSLLSRDPATKTLTIHRVVQAVLQDEMDADTQRRWAERAVRALARGFPDPEFAHWSRCERWLPQALAGARWIERWGFAFAEAADLLNQAASYLQHRARYAEAEPLYQRALAIGEQALGPAHPDTAQSLNNLAVLYDAQGRYGEAEPLYQRALAIYEQALGPEHPRTATSLNNLAGLYDAQGRYGEAEPLLKRALAIDEQARGPEHPDTRTVRENYQALLEAMRQ